MSSSSISLSIIVPTMNSEDYIIETLSNVLAIDSSENIEILVSDNFSSDGTRAILEGFSDSRLRLIYWNNRMSASEHWTEITKKASGEFVKLVCADDIVFAPEVLSQLDLAKSDSRLSMVASPRGVISDSGRLLLKKRGLNSLLGFHKGKEAVKKSLLTGTNDFGEPLCVLFRTSSLMRCLPWDESFPYVIDLDMYSKVLNIGDFYGLEQPVGAFRLAKNSWSNSLIDQQVDDFNNWIDKASLEGRFDLNSKEIASVKRSVRKQGMRRMVVTKLVTLLKL